MFDFKSLAEKLANLDTYGVVGAETDLHDLLTAMLEEIRDLSAKVESLTARVGAVHGALIEEGTLPETRQ